MNFSKIDIPPNVLQRYFTFSMKQYITVLNKNM